MGPPFAKLLAQLAMVYGAAVARAIIHAYRDAAASKKKGSRRAPLGAQRRMSVDEAAKILHLDAATTTLKEVESKFERLRNMNTPATMANFAGSPYLQKKIENAKVVIVEDVLKFRKGTPSEKESKKSASSSPDTIDVQQEPAGANTKGSRMHS